MELKELQCKSLARAQKIAVSNKYIAICTGSTVLLYDKNFELIKDFKGLVNVDSIRISPDEKQLAVLSTRNIFYLVTLDDFNIYKHTIRSPYNGNIEGKGCWSFSGDRLYILAQNESTMRSALRCYKTERPFLYEDFYAEKYWLVFIRPVAQLNKYLIIGLDRNKAMQNHEDCWRMIWFDGANFEEYPLSKIGNDIINSVEFDPAGNMVVLSGIRKTVRCDMYGHVVDIVRTPEEKTVTVSFSDALENGDIDDNTKGEIKELAGLLGVENVSLPDYINKVCISLNQNFTYIATKTGVFVVDKSEQKIEAKMEIKYGAYDIEEFSENTILVSTWNGIKIFKIIP